VTISLGVFLTQLMNMVPEANTELDEPTRNQMIKQAVIDYSRNRPDIVTEDVSGDGGKYYAIVANLASWSDEFSRISAIQYPAPILASDETPVFLKQDDWDQDYYEGTTRYLWLPNHAPAATETMRITYTAPYLWTAGSVTTAITKTSHGHSANDYVNQNDVNTYINAGDSANLLATHQVTAVADADNFTVAALVVGVPETDFFAICNRAGCLVCQAISERFSRESESSVAADRVRSVSRAEQFAKRATEFCQMYDKQMGIMTGSDGVTIERGHAEFIDLDTSPSYPPGRDYLFRGRHTR
jgi:hypothetical protein